jgi:hypothetical protein
MGLRGGDGGELGRGLRTEQKASLPKQHAPACLPAPIVPRHLRHLLQTRNLR